MPEVAEIADEAKEAVEKNRTVALLIAILALFLALSETGAKKAQHVSTEKNIEATDLFNFFQAKRIRLTVNESAASMLEAQRPGVADGKAQEAIEKQIAEFKASVAKLEKDPKKPDETLDRLVERGHDAEKERDESNERLEHYELASGFLQIAIVLASASIITEMVALTWLSFVVGALGAVLMGFGFFNPAILAHYLSLIG